MNISYAWLRALAPGLTDDLESLAERLALLGAPVEGLERLGEGLEDIVIARVVEAGPHPNADRLSLCRVDAGTGEILSVVCGAPNVLSGGTYPFVPVGGRLPGGMEIRRAKIRGEVSNGMLCSPKELGLGVDHAGILELYGDYAPGRRFAEALGLDDARLDVEVTSNRGDLLSHVGVAREVAPGGVAGVSLPPIPGAPAFEPEWVTDAREVEVAGVRVRIEEPELCRRFLGAVVRGVRVGASPDWLQARLRAVGARPINNVVDATNYVLFELGQPTHAYDLARLRGGEVITRLARDGERVQTLDGVQRTLTSSMLVIADAERTVDVAGIMGEETSSVTEATTDVFLECAHFEPGHVRATRKALDIQSDAGYRFERFVDPEGQRRALRRVLEIILATAGGELHPRVADVHPRPWSTPRIELRLARVERVLGVAFDEARVRELLEPLGFTLAAARADVLPVEVPGWRGWDVTREVDLIEEIARRHGFDAFPQELGPQRPNRVPDHPLFRLEDELRTLLSGLGLFEAQTPAFVPESEGDVRLSNPLSREEPVLRRVLLPSLLRRVERNLARGVRDVRLYELGTAFRRVDGDARPHEDTRLCVVLTGRRRPPHWHSADETLDLWDLKGLLDTVVRHAHPAGARLEPGAPPAVPGAAGAPAGAASDTVPAALDTGPDAAWWVAAESWTLLGEDGRVLGRGGRVEPQRVDTPPWAGAIYGLELTLPPEPSPRADPAYRPLPAFPGVERDVALLVPDAVPAARVLEVARGAGGDLLAGVEAFDLFRGGVVPAGTRSLAHRFRFRSPERTLTDDEVERAIRAILDRLREELGVHVRG